MLGIAALELTRPAGLSAADGLAGYPRLVLFALSAILLALTASVSAAGWLKRPIPEIQDPEPFPGTESRDLSRASFVGQATLAIGLATAIGLAAWNVVRLRQQVEGPVGHALWLGSMALLLAITLIPQVFRLDWSARWSDPSFKVTPSSSSPVRRSLPWLILAVLFALAAAARFPALGDLPIGIQADEGDRANWALRVLNGQAPASWFGDGWYLINLVYFRLLAAFMSVFGTSVAGTRTMSAIAGTLFVAVVAWIGCRHFSWRVGLLATALATTGALYVQQSRFIGESGVTALLWAVSLAGFLEGGRTGRAWAFALAGLGGGLALYFYPSGRLWVVGAALTMIFLLIRQPRRHRWAMVRGGIVAAVAALIAVAPFLVHIESNPSELTARYDETSVLVARNQPRLSYLNPPVSTPELFALQFERTLGMFDRYPDGVSFLPTSRPALPQPLGALTIVGILYVAARSLRDPRCAIISVWYALGIAGVFLTVETPDFLRASGALVTFPLFAALLLTDLADRIGFLAARFRSTMGGGRTLLPRRVTLSLIGSVAVAAIAGQAYLYFMVYPPLMAPSWSYASQEGLQINRLGQAGPVFGLEMFDFHVTSGWIRFLAQGVTIGEIPNPGQELPILFTEESSPTDAVTSLQSRPDQAMSFILYPDPNQQAFSGFLMGLYPEGTLQAPIDGRRAFVVPAAAVNNSFGAMVKVGDNPNLVHVAGLGTLPPDFSGPAAVEWHASFRLPRSGRYKFKLTSSHPATLDIDGVTVTSGDGGDSIVEIAAARGIHFIRVSAEGITRSDRIAVARTGQNGSAATFHELGRAELFASADGEWGLLGHVVRGGNDSRSAANVADSFVDSTVAALDLPRYVSIDPNRSTIVWEGKLIAPRDGVYRFGITSDGTTGLEIDGKKSDVPGVKWEEWKDNLPGAQIRLTAGSHALKLTLHLASGGRSIVRLNWVPPKPDGQLDGGAPWSVVPPNVLRAPPAVWLP